METAIGVFSSRHGAEEAVKQLRRQGIPEQAIVFLTWSENEAKVAARRLAGIAGLAGGAADASVAIAEFLLPGMGTVFALGFGKVTLLRLAAVRAASAVGLHVMEGEKTPQPVSGITADVTSNATSDMTSDEKSKYAAFFREVLKDGRSLVMVRTESRELVASASHILDRLGLGLEERTSSELRITSRQVGEAVVIEMSGRITVGGREIFYFARWSEIWRKAERRILFSTSVGSRMWTARDWANS
ncbi:MAG TPA: hypothetical protein VFA90_02715 [Terriglobales bacterium]|nr:hypothetical protein [Terriglobales bacterium]